MSAKWMFWVWCAMALVGGMAGAGMNYVMATLLGANMWAVAEYMERDL